jgi:tryptophanyl-tRNA synthetase
MAADILAYQADYVPVGEDQKQHVELTRDLAIRFNHRYGDTFKVPEPLIAKVGARIMSLSDPSKKMSKSDDNDKGCIYLLDDPKVAYKKVMSAVTDSLGLIQYDVVNQSGVSNLLVIHASLSGKSIDELVFEFKGKGYGDLKKAVAQEVVKLLEDLQAKHAQILESGKIYDVLRAGEAHAQKIAEKTLKNAQRALGIEI